LLDHYSPLQDGWVVDSHSFTAPLVKGQPEQLLIFADHLRNGSVAADVTILDSADREAGSPFNEAALVVRYAPPNTHIYAGIGGFGRKYFIGSPSSRHRFGCNILRLDRQSRLRSIRTIGCR
jgi:hypothetical protein